MYTGREYLQELKIYDYRNRFYFTPIGRFLQTDPTGFDAGDMNLFRYVGDDPVDLSDPTGLVASDTSRPLPDRMWEMACFFDSGNSFQGSLIDFMQRLSPPGMDGGQGGRDGNLIMAGQYRNDASPKRQSEGAAPPSRDLVRSMYAAHLKNVEEATKPKNWDTFPGTTVVRKNEYSAAISRTRNGLQTTAPQKGYWQNGPKSDIPNVPGRVAGVHVHVTGDGRHLNWDRDQAIRHHYISGVGHISAPHKLEIFVPSSRAYFITEDGEHVHPGRWSP